MILLTPPLIRPTVAPPRETGLLAYNEYLDVQARNTKTLVQLNLSETAQASSHVSELSSFLHSTDPSSTAMELLTDCLTIRQPLSPTTGKTGPFENNELYTCSPVWSACCRSR